MEKEFERLITEAIHLKATDLHFKSQYIPNIEMRVQGKIALFKTLVLDKYQKLIAYLIYRANINLNHHQQPQTGAFHLQIDNQDYYFRLSYLPSGNDVHLVLRILNHHEKITFEMLSSDETTKHKLRKLLKKDSGLMIVCGPTGSGKSTTLHAFLDEIANMGQKSLMSIEDPIEIYHRGVVQIQVNEQQQLDFATILNQVLRHDPDVVMIGEIRDETSANIAMRLALTGHLILTTLHTFSVKSAITRLENLGLSQDDLKDVLNGIIFQRLIYPKKQANAQSFFEIATASELKCLMDRNEITYPLMEDILKEALKRGEVDEEDIEAYID